MSSSTSDADILVELCGTCDGLGYLHGAVPITCTDIPHRTIVGRAGIEPCDDCTPCPDCGRDGCAPGVRWADDALVDVTSAQELADARRRIEELEAGVAARTVRELTDALLRIGETVGGCLDHESVPDAVTRRLSAVESERDARGEILDRIREAMGLGEDREWSDCAEVGRAALNAVKYLLDRAQRNPDLYYEIGWGTQAFLLLTRAEAEARGIQHATVERERCRVQFGDRKAERERIRELPEEQ